VSDLEVAASKQPKPSDDEGSVTGGVITLNLAPALRDSAGDRKRRDERQAREQLAAQRVESPRESTNAIGKLDQQPVATEVASATPPSPDPSETCSRASKKPLHDGELRHTVVEDEDLLLRPCPRAANCV